MFKIARLISTATLTLLAAGAALAQVTTVPNSLGTRSGAE